MPLGRAVTFYAENAGEPPHSFGVVVGFETMESPVIDPGGAGKLTVPSFETGSYDALCTVPGHDGLGMVTTVVASDDPTADGGAQATSHTASRRRGVPRSDRGHWQRGAEARDR